jgi:hypothetical protein
VLLTNFLKICGNHHIKELEMHLKVIEKYNNRCPQKVFTHVSKLQSRFENLQVKFGDSIHFIQRLHI